MVHIEENDVMIDFYLSPTILQKNILSQYQDQSERGKKRETLIRFLEENFRMEIIAGRRNRYLST